MYRLIEQNIRKKSKTVISNFLYYPESWFIMNVTIKMRQYVNFINSQNFDTAEIKCLLRVHPQLKHFVVGAGSETFCYLDIG